MHRTRRSGFTLVELSIVLVILGLLVGGVLAGQSLIRAAELRTLARDRDIYMTAIYAFQEKYMALPGDMPNAVRFWGSDPAGSSTADGVNADCANSNNSTPMVETCNGDGSGLIADGGDVTDNRDQWYEGYRAWQQLANAGLIQGQYAGTNMVSSDRKWLNSVRGQNVPSSNIGKDAGWTFRSKIMSGGVGAYPWSLPASSFLTIGNQGGLGEGAGPVLTPEEAWNFDIKTDDGRPGHGRVFAFTAPINPDCMVDPADSDNTDYNLTLQSTACTMIFVWKK